MQLILLLVPNATPLINMFKLAYIILPLSVRQTNLFLSITLCFGVVKAFGMSRRLT